jgi:hypothetical protein
MSATGVATPRLDAHLGKFSQAGTVVLAGLAFVLSQPIIVLITGLILALSALVPAFSPYRLIYRFVLLPLHILHYHLGRLGLMPRVRYEGSFHWRGV